MIINMNGGGSGGDGPYLSVFLPKVVYYKPSSSYVRLFRVLLGSNTVVGRTTYRYSESKSQSYTTAYCLSFDAGNVSYDASSTYSKGASWTDYNISEISNISQNIISYGIGSYQSSNNKIGILYSKGRCMLKVPILNMRYANGSTTSTASLYPGDVNYTFDGTEPPSIEFIINDGVLEDISFDFTNGNERFSQLSSGSYAGIFQIEFAINSNDLWKPTINAL